MNPLTLLARDPDFGHLTVASINAYWEPAIVEAGGRSPVADLLATTDLEFVVATVLSLLAIVLSYDAVCGERERGTLRLALSYSVSRAYLLTSKWLGAACALAIPVGLSFLSGACILSIGFGLGLDAAFWQGFAAYTMCALLMLLVVLALGVFVSSQVDRSSTAIVVLLLVWTLAAVIVPAVGPHLAQAVVPLPTPAHLERQKLQARTEIEARFLALRDEHPPSEFDGWLAWGAWADSLRGDQFVEQLRSDERINETYRHDLGEQVELARTLTRLSPVASFRLISAGLTATGPREADRLWEALVDYRSRLTRFGFDGWGEMAMSNHRRKQQGLRVISTYVVDQWPRFSYSTLALRERLDGVLVDIALLCLWGGLFLLLGYRAFSRADVT